MCGSNDSSVRQNDFERCVEFHEAFVLFRSLSSNLLFPGENKTHRLIAVSLSLSGKRSRRCVFLLVTRVAVKHAFLL
jgi:hypothetical protein